MHTKSKYKEKPQELPNQLPEQSAIEKAELPPVIAAPKKDDEETVVAFRAQLEAATTAQSLQKQQAIELAQQAQAREQKLQVCAAKGMPASDIQFLRDHPELLQQVAQPAMQETPAFFQPPSEPVVERTSDFVAAPVSRNIPDSNGSYEPKGQVKLTADEIQIARASGVSLADYARGKVRLEHEKKTGLRQY